MPRSGGGIYSKGSPSAVSGTTIQSAAYNTTIDDLVTDANAARPVSAGGTGAANAADARTNLGISATNTPFTPAGNIAATTTQAALAELDTEKAALAGATFTGGISGTTGTFSGVVSGADASADGHLLNRITADGRYARNTVYYRNRIVNGSMQISQERGTALVDVTTGSTLVYSIDQWVAALSTTPGGTLRIQQVASASPAGSPFRLRHTAQVADASIAAGDTYAIVHYIEGQMIADARLGSASARQIVIRFGVRSSLAGTFGVSLRNSAANRSYVTTITIAGGEINTDLVRTIVIPGDTSGTWLTDTGIGLQLTITLAAGTTFQGTAGSWQGSNLLTTSSQTNFMGTASATFELFDVGLYVDPLAIGVAPPFEVPDFADELLRCHRYFRKEVIYKLAGGIPATSISVGGRVQFQPMRVVPTLGTTNDGSTGLIGSRTFSVPTNDSVEVSAVSTGSGGFIIDTSFNVTARF
jgi:hypothetical protein